MARVEPSKKTLLITDLIEEKLGGHEGHFKCLIDFSVQFKDPVYAQGQIVLDAKRQFVGIKNYIEMVELTTHELKMVTFQGSIKNRKIAGVSH